VTAAETGIWGVVRVKLTPVLVLGLFGEKDTL
jgi:hypothetical protein